MAEAARPPRVEVAEGAALLCRGSGHRPEPFQPGDVAAGLWGGPKRRTDKALRCPRGSGNLVPQVAARQSRR